ncbi:hypothetical protein [Pseudovibrio sp. SPO723]|uniref:hypothetical protein n=1 Tax=Nesiotobacter zosterae TaxID=392721 RepID=UPI0029CA0415|nr:hypothetical protein [Pseudovibrio sp. SPO723]
MNKIKEAEKKCEEAWERAKVADLALEDFWEQYDMANAEVLRTMGSPFITKTNLTEPQMRKFLNLLTDSSAAANAYVHAVGQLRKAEKSQRQSALRRVQHEATPYAFDSLVKRSWHHNR